MLNINRSVAFTNWDTSLIYSCLYIKHYIQLHNGVFEVFTGLTLLKIMLSKMLR